MLKRVFIKNLQSFIANNICGVLILFCGSNLISQVFYSTKPDYLKTKTEKNNLLSNYKASYPDTSITDFYNFFPRNFSGNIGLPSPSYILNYNTADLGFRLYQPPLANDMFNEKSVEYYRSKGPYANLTGVAGSKQLQVFKLLFTHTYREKVNITLRLNRYSSQGFYLKQQSFANNFFVTSNYTKSNQRAGYYLYFLNNGNRNQENGGIKGDTLTAESVMGLKALLPVKLTSASHDNKEYKFMFNPWIKLNRASDSLNKLNNYLQLKSKFAFNTYKYKDANPHADKFYQIIYLDTLKTYDSSRVMQFTNEVNYSLLKSSKNFGASIGYKNEINRVWQKRDSLFFNNIVCGDIVFKKNITNKDSLKSLKSQIENRFNLQYVVKGASLDNYKIENQSEINFVNKFGIKIFLNVMAEKRSPDYIHNYWISNNFEWFNNGYKPQQIQQAQLGFSQNRKIGLSIGFQNINNYLYFDNLALPRQYAGDIQNINVTAYYSVVLLKHLGLSFHNIFQTTSHASYVSLPQNISTFKIFYAGNLFKNNLQLNIGLQAQAYQSFYGYSYMPSTQLFYLQDKKKTGDYPYVDFYINARIRPVTIFVKIENILQGYAGINYSLVPGYYQSDRAFRLGISWMFFD